MKQQANLSESAGFDVSDERCHRGFLLLIPASAAVFGLAAWTLFAPPNEQTIAAYSTSFAGRTDSQIHNVRLAARCINGKSLMPDETFSFLKTVGQWTADRGYSKAPVSYDGELMLDWGGGVCQLSTTLYNAALLAGLEIVERHRHQWPARYAAPGRDAAVAHEEIDLKFRNNLAAPIKVVCSVEGEKLICKLLSSQRPPFRVAVHTRIVSVTRPRDVFRHICAQGVGQPDFSDIAAQVRSQRVATRGHLGFHVLTFRTFTSPQGSRTELVSEDDYPALNRVVKLVRY